MKAAVIEQFGEPITIQTMPDPTPPRDGVVIKVHANGICRSDWHAWQGHDPDITSLPHIPGHELAGEIVAVGEDVKRWRGGERVTAPFSLGCGRCPLCSSGNHQICDDYYQPGFTGWGAFAEYIALPYADVNLVEIPEQLSDVEMASLGCRFVTAYRGVVAQGRVRGGEFVAVHGCGGVGLSAIMIAVAMGAQVIAIDINAETLAFAQQLGAMATINASQVDDVVEAVQDLTNGGAHLSLDTLGSTQTCLNSILNLRKRGRHVQIGILAGEQANPPLPANTIMGKELEIIGSHGMQAHTYDELFAMILQGKVKPSELVTETVSLEESPSVLQRMTNFATKGVIVIDRF